MDQDATLLAGCRRDQTRESTMVEDSLRGEDSPSAHILRVVNTSRDPHRGTEVVAHPDRHAATPGQQNAQADDGHDQSTDRRPAACASRSDRQLGQPLLAQAGQAPCQPKTYRHPAARLESPARDVSPNSPNGD